MISQLRRGVCALPLNVAEGTGSISYRRYLVFLSAAYASAIEMQSALRICYRLGYFPQGEHKEFAEKLDGFLRMMWSYMRYVENQTEERDRMRFGLQRRLHGVAAPPREMPHQDN
jgi:four helix bundle protein